MAYNVINYQLTDDNKGLRAYFSVNKWRVIKQLDMTKEQKQIFKKLLKEI